MIDTGGKFYLGRTYDPTTRQVTDKPYLYNPADLTTHAVVVGMTGSGKTGLCIDMLEEAALQGIPAMMIDPKGDLTNLLLHFPDLAPADFQPWVNADNARRDSKSLEQAAVEAAESWRAGLAKWEIGPERLRALSEAVEFAVYTPGSEAGLPVSILASLKAPPIPWESNREALREKINSTVTALLGLVGLTDIDPVRSREHILLANLFEHAWSQGKDLDLSELILQTQSPPFARLGVFDVNTFFPEKERFNLAMLLNNILAAPSFQTWIEGQPLDIPGLLYTPAGRPRHSIFSLSHLNDAERMFFVTLLFSAVEGWMRSQPGSDALRAILYFDEIYGYLPAVANPSSKPPLLRMLKQARAFGVGLALVTQNPVDLDYKALSNAGTWFIGKLQTDQDKQRLLDGLESVLAGGLDRGDYDRLISTLDKRVFLAHNVHQPAGSGGSGAEVLFQTRWAMNYLAGPLTRAQFPALLQLSAAGQPQSPSHSFESSASPIIAEPVPAPIPVGTAAPVSPRLSTTRPVVPAGFREYFLPNNLSFTEAFQAAGKAYPQEAFSQGVIYRPALLAQANIRYLNRKYGVDFEQPRTILEPQPDRRGVVRWEQSQSDPVKPQSLDDQPVPGAQFAPLEAPLSEPKILSALQKDFLDWAYRTSQAEVRANETLKVYAGPGVSQAEFRTQCAEAARAGRDAEAEKLKDGYDRKIEALQAKLNREQRELRTDETELKQRKMEEVGSAAETLLGLFGGRRSSRRLSTSLSKRRMTSQAKADVEESRDSIEEMTKQIQELEQEKAVALEEITRRWGEVANQITEIPLAPLKKDILLDLFGVAWIPYYQVKAGTETIELPGYSADL